MPCGSLLAHMLRGSEPLWPLLQADLISNLLGTDMIPCWSLNQTYHRFRNSPVIDGGYAVGFEDLCPKGTNTSACIKVASWVTGGWRCRALAGRPDAIKPSCRWHLSPLTPESPGTSLINPPAKNRCSVVFMCPAGPLADQTCYPECASGCKSVDRPNSDKIYTLYK